MRLVRLAIWLATIFCALMLFVPLVRQIAHELSNSGFSDVP